MSNFYVKKLKLRLTKNQTEQINSYLKDATFYFNLYLEINHEFYNKYKEYIENDNIDPVSYPFYKFIKVKKMVKELDRRIINEYNWFHTKKYAIRDDIKKKVISNIMNGFMMFREELNAEPPSFKDILKGEMVRSIWLPNSKRKIRIDSKYPNRIKVQYLKWVYVYNIEYLNDIDFKNIQSARIVRELDNSFSLCLLINKCKKFDLGKLKGGIGVKVGLDNYITIEGKKSLIIPNPYESIPKLKLLKNKEKQLHSIIQKKKEKIFTIHSNLKSYEIWNIIHKSRKMQDLYNRRRKIMYRIDCIIDNFMKKYAKYILLKVKPQFIVIEDLRIHKRGFEDEPGKMEKILNCKFQKFLKILKNFCFEAGIEVRVAPKDLQFDIYDNKKASKEAALILYNLNDYSIAKPN